MKYPFSEFLYTDMNLSMTSIQLALAMYRKIRYIEASTLFVSYDHYELAKEIINTYPQLPRLQIVMVPFYEKEWWSVGRLEPDHGFGGGIIV